MYPNIAAERARQNMSVSDLADALGVSRKTIYNWEKSGNIPQKALQKMSEIFNCSVDYLISHRISNPNKMRNGN